MARIFVFVCAAVWLACVIASLFALNVAPTGDSFLRGFNRISGFLAWQGAALVPAIGAAWALKLVAPPRARILKVLGLTPSVLSAIGVVILVGIIAWAILAPPPPPDPLAPMPTTEAPTTVAPE